MQKEINNKYLYTAIYEYDGDVFYNQFYSQNEDLKALLKVWARMAIRKKIVVIKEDRRILLKEKLADDLYKLVPIMHSQNAWWTFFLLSKDLGSLVIIKTNKMIVGGSSKAKTKVILRYDFYREKYENLKDLPIKTKEIDKERKKYDRLMLYWKEKKQDILIEKKEDKALYTIILEYNGDVFVYQFYVFKGESINNIIKRFSVVLKEHNCFLDNKNYEIVYERANNVVYELIPLKDIINVWSTYFTLTKGIGNVYVIKTDEEMILEEK